MHELRASVAASVEELATGSASLNCFEVQVQRVQQVNSTQASAARVAGQLRAGEC